MPETTTVSDERVQEILDHLNSFVAYEYESGTDLFNGRAVPYREVAGVLDAGLDAAIEWAQEQPETLSTEGPNASGANVELTDGTSLAWFPQERRWVVEASEAEVTLPTRSIDHWADQLRRHHRKCPDDSLYPYVVGVIDAVVGSGVAEAPLVDVRNVIAALAIVHAEMAAELAGQ